MDFIDSAAKKAANIFNDALKRYILTIRPLTNPLYQRWAIAILLCIVLSVILAPEIHVFTPKYEIGTISTHDIKADRDFLVEDQESTRQKKLDAGENIKSVYDYDGNLTAAIQGKIAKAFDSIEEFRQNIPAGKTTELTAFNNQEVRKLKKNLDTNFGFSLAPEEFYALMEQKDPEGLKQKINLFVTSFYENRYITATSFTKGEKEKGIILRDIKT
nr:hypothetical protein [Smithellaceae bacterium]